MRQGRYTIFYCGISLIYHGIYTYTDIIGESLDWSNIVIFFGVAGLVYLVETKMFLGNKTCRIPSEYAFAMLCIIGIVFFVFTFYPPEIPFFQDSVSKTYVFFVMSFSVFSLMLSVVIVNFNEGIWHQCSSRSASSFVQCNVP